jgi:hypothetical protein
VACSGGDDITTKKTVDGGRWWRSGGDDITTKKTVDGGRWWWCVWQIDDDGVVLFLVIMLFWHCPPSTVHPSAIQPDRRDAEKKKSCFVLTVVIITHLHDGIGEGQIHHCFSLQIPLHNCMVCYVLKQYRMLYDVRKAPPPYLSNCGRTSYYNLS